MLTGTRVVNVPVYRGVVNSHVILKIRLRNDLQKQCAVAGDPDGRQMSRQYIHYCGVLELCISGEPNCGAILTGSSVACRAFRAFLCHFCDEAIRVR
jgi:hypothetical protein